MGEPSPQVDTRRSFVRVICPFRFQSALLPTVIRRAEQPPGTSPVSWDRADFPSVLAGTGRYINASDVETSAAGAWRCKQTASAGEGSLHVGRTYFFRLKRRLYLVKLEAVELTVFGTGVGFVVLEFGARGLPKGRNLTEDVASATSPTTWIELAKLVRRGDFFHTPMLHSHLGLLYGAKSDPDQGSATAVDACRLRDYLDLILASIGLQLISPAEEPVDLEDNNAVFLSEQNFAFLSLFVTGASDEQVREWADRLRYSMNTPAEYGPAAASAGLQRRSHQSFLYGSLTAAGFIGSDLPNEGYWQNYPSELRRQYQLALLIALQQRHALLALSSMVSDRWLNADRAERVSEFDRIQDRLQYLSARLMPVQVLARSSQQQFYTTMRDSLKVESLYQNVRQTISELTESLRLRLSEDQGLQQVRFERRVSVLALVFGVPSLVLAFLAIDIRGMKPFPLVILLAIVMASFTVGLLVAFTIRRRNH